MRKLTIGKLRVDSENGLSIGMKDLLVVAAFHANAIMVERVSLASSHLFVFVLLHILEKHVTNVSFSLSGFNWVINSFAYEYFCVNCMAKLLKINFQIV